MKLRIKSVESTEHITRAMQLVASSKLRRATERMEVSRAYFKEMKTVFADLYENCGGELPEGLFTESQKGDRCLVVIAGDRGLAGGYNNNVFSLSSSVMAEEKGKTVVLPLGKKSYEYYKKRNTELTGRMQSVEEMTLERCAVLGKELAEGFRTGKYRSVSFVYTSFKNMLSQSAGVLQVLPLVSEKKNAVCAHPFMVYEPSPAEVFEALIPEYVAGLLYCAVCESSASEQASRRNAMDNATKNADEMIKHLSLQYNRARQGAITQEITEIVAGAEQ